MTTWDVLHWPPERVALAEACMHARNARRKRVLGLTDDKGNKARVMTTLDIDDLL